MSDLKTAALEYHANPRPGKLSVELTKATATARDLSLAYSPGVAEPVREIARDPELAYKYTGKGNLVAVISDGTAILGLVCLYLAFSWGIVFLPAPILAAVGAHLTARAPIEDEQLDDAPWTVPGS